MKRELKRASWEYDFNTHKLKLLVWIPTGAPLDSETEPPFIPETITLNRTYMFSLMRFMVSVAQKLRIEEGKKLRGKMNLMKGKYLERIDRLKISNKNLRTKKNK